MPTNVLAIKARRGASITVSANGSQINGAGVRGEDVLITVPCTFKLSGRLSTINIIKPIQRPWNLES